MTRAEQIIRSGQYLRKNTIADGGIELARQGKKYMELLEEYAQILEAYTRETVGKAELSAGKAGLVTE